MSEAVVPPADGEVAAHVSAIARIEQDLRTRRDAVAARLEAMGASACWYTYEVEYTIGPARITLPRDEKGVSVTFYALRVEEAEAALAGLEAAKAEPDPAEPSAGDVADALPEFLAQAGDYQRSWAQLRAQLAEALADRDRARQQRDEAERDAVAERAAREEAAEGAAKLLDRLNTAEGKLLAIADLLNEDEERSPSFDADDKPIPLVDRVRVALMPDGFGKSAWERRVTEILDQHGAPVAFGSEIPASPYGRVLLTARLLKEERERAKEQAQEIYDAGRVLTILGAPPHLPLREALMRVLSLEDHRAVLEVEAAEARAALVRVRALRVDPAAPGVVAEYEARAAAAQAALGDLPAELEED